MSDIDVSNEFHLDKSWVGYRLHAQKNAIGRYSIENKWAGFTT